MILKSSCNLVRFDAMRADIHLSDSSVLIHFDSLNVRIPLSSRVDVGMADCIS